MDYEQKYKEALKAMEGLYNVVKYHSSSEALLTLQTIEKAFHELKESEDERIRKFLHHTFTAQYLAKDKLGKWHGEPVTNILAWLEKQGEPQDKGEISDGYHTFNELYYYRMLYNAAFFNMLPKECVQKSKKHNDGEDCFGGGWFIVMANLPTGQISNHYELKNWDLFQIPEKEVADKWDGHTPTEAADRLHKYLLEKQGEQKHDDWSEWDELRCQSTTQVLEYARSLDAYNQYGKENIAKNIAWLKSLKPNHWRPSKYDVSLLEEIVRNIRNNVRPFCSEVSSLEDLIENLKNL